uniref:Putative secreted protein n=1 Tax=Anopheles marajoara TaxID=58244 RepID=A0A2M4CFN1_9DIPT
MPLLVLLQLKHQTIGCLLHPRLLATSCPHLIGQRHQTHQIGLVGFGCKLNGCFTKFGHHVRIGTVL